MSRKKMKLRDVLDEEGVFKNLHRNPLFHELMDLNFLDLVLENSCIHETFKSRLKEIIKERVDELGYAEVEV